MASVSSAAATGEDRAAGVSVAENEASSRATATTCKLGGTGALVDRVKPAGSSSSSSFSCGSVSSRNNRAIPPKSHVVSGCSKDSSHSIPSSPIARISAAASFMQGRRPKQEDRHVVAPDLVHYLFTQNQQQKQSVPAAVSVSNSASAEVKKNADTQPSNSGRWLSRTNASNNSDCQSGKISEDPRVESVKKKLNCNPVSMFALFDGHQGSLASDWCAQYLPKQILTDITKLCAPGPSQELPSSPASPANVDSDTATHTAPVGREKQKISPATATKQTTDSRGKNSNAAVSEITTTTTTTSAATSVTQPSATQLDNTAACAPEGCSSNSTAPLAASSIPPATVSKTLVNAFLKVDNSFLHKYRVSRDGCTAVLAFVLGSRVYMATLGDSRAVLGTCATGEEGEDESGCEWRRQGDTFIEVAQEANDAVDTNDADGLDQKGSVGDQFTDQKVDGWRRVDPGDTKGEPRNGQSAKPTFRFIYRACRLTEDHKPERPDERQRIASNGGFVLNVGGIYRVAPNDYEARVKRIKLSTCTVGGSSERPPVLLAVSRAMGDRDLKQPGSRLISATPEITWFDLDVSKHRFICMACDGVWDVLSDQDVVNIVSRYMDRPEEASSAVIRSAFGRGSQVVTPNYCILSCA